MSSFEMKPVTSGIIASIGHNRDTKTLRVQFHSGRTYDYTDVSDEMFSLLQGAKSVGGHLHSHIKPNCTARECRDA